MDFYRIAAHEELTSLRLEDAFRHGCFSSLSYFTTFPMGFFLCFAAASASNNLFGSWYIDINSTDICIVEWPCRLGIYYPGDWPRSTVHHARVHAQLEYSFWRRHRLQTHLLACALLHSWSCCPCRKIPEDYFDGWPAWHELTRRRCGSCWGYMAVASVRDWTQVVSTRFWRPGHVIKLFNGDFLQPN